MCSLFGYSGKNGPNPLSIKLMAIYGNRRGKDGFGMVINKKLNRWCGYEKGVNLADSFELTFGKTLSSNSPIIIGHNRMKSKGWITKENTHPFEYNDIENKRWFFAHNGTISNIDDLAREYGIANPVGEVDSKILGEIIYRHGFNVLSEYEGYAAFSLYDATEDTLYLWKGFSQCDSAIACEERPLHYYHNKKKDKFYYASEFLTLITALNTEDNIYEVEDNCLMKIQHGKIVERTYYDRSHIRWVSKIPAYSHASSRPATGGHYRPSEEDLVDYYSSTGTKSVTADELTSKEKRKRYKDKTTKASKKDNWDPEPCPQNDAKGKVYFWKGRYYVNGHLLKGAYWIDRADRSYTMIDMKQIDEAQAFYYDYFVDGIMMKDYNTYLRCVENKANFIGDGVSIYAVSCIIHPDTIYFRKTDFAQNNWTMYHGDKMVLAGEKVVPLFSDYEYGKNHSGGITVIKINEDDDKPEEDVLDLNKQLAMNWPNFL